MKLWHLRIKVELYFKGEKLEPHEIQPDTKLCTILGLMGQNSLERKVFNAILKEDAINATAIALNIKEEHFEFTFANVAKSKIDKVILLDEFKERVRPFCDVLAGQNETIDYLEIREGKISAFSLAQEIEFFFSDKEMLDANIIKVAKMLFLAHKWYGVRLDINRIPMLLGEDK
jgi:hypothetical protein